MEKLNKTLEDYLRKITPYNNWPNGVEASLDNAEFEELVQVNTYLSDLESLGFLRLSSEKDGLYRRSGGRVVTIPAYFSLTSKGETYFTEIEKQEQSNRRKELRDRWWQVATIIISVLLSAVVGLATQSMRQSDQNDESPEVVNTERHDA